MKAQATGTFTVTSWDENTYAELGGGAKLTRAQVTFGLSGDLDGAGRWEALMCYAEDGTATFTGLQHTTGKLGGREGGFVLRADGTFSDGQARTNWEVIPGSATGELRGLRGSGQAISASAPGGSFMLEYSLD